MPGRGRFSLGRPDNPPGDDLKRFINTAPVAVISSPSAGFIVLLGEDVLLRSVGTFDRETGWTGTWTIISLVTGAIRFTSNLLTATWTTQFAEAVRITWDVVDESGEHGIISIDGTVQAAPQSIPTSLLVTPGSMIISVGQQSPIQGQVLDQFGSPMSGQTIGWLSEAPSIVSASPSTGSQTTATGIAAGSTAIRASSPPGGGVQASCGITVLAPSGDNPHEPVGLTRFFESNWSGPKPQGFPNGTAQIDGFAMCEATNRLTIESDTSAPRSPSGVLQWRYPNGLTGGSGVGIMQAWDTSSEVSSTEFSEIYDTGYFWLGGTPGTADQFTFQNNPVGCKPLGYWGVGERGSVVPSQVYSILAGDGTVTPKATWFTISFFQQGQVSRTLNRNKTAVVTRAGFWHRYEHYMKVNTFNQPNGILRSWMDNGDGNGLRMTHEYTDVIFRCDSATSLANGGTGVNAPSGFYGRRWDPIWGGGGGVKTRDDFVRCDHLYISGRV